jgi:hypothetical protein
MKLVDIVIPPSQLCELEQRINLLVHTVYFRIVNHTNGGADRSDSCRPAGSGRRFR